MRPKQQKQDVFQTVRTVTVCATTKTPINIGQGKSTLIQVTTPFEQGELHGFVFSLLPDGVLLQATVRHNSHGCTILVQNFSNQVLTITEGMAIAEVSVISP